MTPAREDVETTPRERVSLAVGHPSLDLAFVSQVLSVEPSRTWRAGEPRTTPRDRPLAGHHLESYWVAHLPDAPVGAADALDAWLARLEAQCPLFAELRATGGTIQLTVSLSGGAHLGASFSPVTLERLARFGATLSVAFHEAAQD